MRRSLLLRRRGNKSDDDDEDNPSTATISLGANCDMSSPATQPLADKFQVLEEIGCGSFGVVYKAIEKETGTIVAIKHIDLEASEDDIVEIQQEISVLGTCASPHVTKYYGSFVKGYKLWIVMEYLGGGSGVDLLKPGPFSEPHIAAVCREILLGLDYLHTEGKIHRDIKAANILFSSQGHVKLADFGVATQLSHMKSTRNTFVGTPFWMAPEVIQQSGYGFKADLWSLGITAMEFANGEPPHAHIHPMKVLFIIPKEPAPRLQGNFSPAFKDFIAQCLIKDPSKRPSARELLKHKFIRSAGKIEAIQELIERKQQWNASKEGRRRSEEVKFYQETVKGWENHHRAEEEGDDEEPGWIFETVKQRDSLVRKPPCDELRTVARKSSPSQKETALKAVNMNHAHKSPREKRATSGTVIRASNGSPNPVSSNAQSNVPRKPSPGRPKSTGPRLITPEMVFGKDVRTVRAISGDADPAPRRPQKDSGVGLPFGKPQTRDSFEGLFQEVLDEVQSVRRPQHEQLVLAQLADAWSNLSLISPDLENALLQKLADKLQQREQQSAKPVPTRTSTRTSTPTSVPPHSPPRPLPTPPPTRTEKSTIGQPPPTPPEDESDKHQIPRRASNSSSQSNQSSGSKPSLSGVTCVDDGPPPMAVPVSPPPISPRHLKSPISPPISPRHLKSPISPPISARHLKSPVSPPISARHLKSPISPPASPRHLKSPIKDSEKRYKKRKSYLATEIIEASEKDYQDKEKESLSKENCSPTKEGKGGRKRDSMHGHISSYTEQLESMLYGQWLNRLGARWPLAHVGAGGGGK